MTESNEHPYASQDMIPRRIVMRQQTWDELVEIAAAMTKEKGFLVTPNDVATMSIEAGRVAIKNGTAEHPAWLLS